MRKILFLALILLFGLTNCVLQLDKIADIPFEQVKSGTYTGKDNLEFMIKVEVAVTVEQPRVTKIEIIEHDCGLGKKAEVIVDDVLEQQSLQVDAITGATGSSNTILKAIENALRQGLE